MGREQDRERLFSRSVDRLVAGDEPETGPAGDADLGTATEFARKMVALRAQPSARFKAGLKASLLQRLNEQEAAKNAEAKPNWPLWLVPRRLVWQVVYAALFAVVVGGVMWGAGVFRSGVAPTRPPAPGVVLQVQANVDKFFYQPGEQVRIRVVLKNVSPGPVPIEKFPPIVSLMRTESRQPVYTFSAGGVARTLAPDAEADFLVVWDQRDDRGGYVAAGSYYVELEDMELESRTIPLMLAEPVRFDIRATQ
ncbi:MAG: hypothetical protein HY673_19065 [Chloroflexi bacterium]|nr:hypothetical protein [Chloroflexota bacterium]